MAHDTAEEAARAKSILGSASPSRLDEKLLRSGHVMDSIARNGTGGSKGMDALSIALTRSVGLPM